MEPIGQISGCEDAAVTQRPDVRRRHQDRSEASRRRILEVARQLLEERSFHELSTEDVARGAELTRTAFYRHFADLEQLLLALLDELGADLDLVADPWETGADGDPTEQLRRALESLTQLFVTHGRLLRALVDAASQYDEVARRHAALAAGFSGSAAARITLDIAAGRSQVTAPEDVAAALVWMNERYLLDLFGQQPLGDPERAARTLTEIWLRTVYGRS